MLYLNTRERVAELGRWISWMARLMAGGIKGASLKASFNSTAQTGYDANALMHFQFHQAVAVALIS